MHRVSAVTWVTMLVLLSWSSIRAQDPNADYSALALRWAPFIYQDTDSELGNDRQDYITDIYYDENVGGPGAGLELGDNWENIDEGTLRAYVYYSAVESETHFFFGYYFYHPRDWEGAKKADSSGKSWLPEHEHDLEGVMLVVAKSTGALELMYTQAHGDTYYFFPVDADGPHVVDLPEPDPCWEDKSLDHRDHLYGNLQHCPASEDSTLYMVDDERTGYERAAAFIECRGHGVGQIARAMVSDVDGPHNFADQNYSFRGDNGILYRPSMDGEPQVPAGLNGEVDYALLPLHDYFWVDRHDPDLFQDFANITTKRDVAIAGVGATINADGWPPGGANPPWYWDENANCAEAGVCADDTHDIIGDWLLDPAEFVRSHVSNYPALDDPDFGNYVYNRFLAGDNSIVVETPSIWVSGASATILWDAREASSPQSGISETCFAQLLAADGAPVWTRSQIVTSTESQNITVPSVTAGTYRLLIHAWSENGEFLPIDGYSAPFEIVAGLPIQILSPFGYDIWSIGEVREIMWQPIGAGDVLIEASADGGASWRTIAGPVPNNGVFNWTVTGPASLSSLIRISTVEGNLVGTSTLPFGVMWPNAFSVTPAALDFGVVPYPSSGGWVWEEVRRTFQACNSSPDVLYAYPTVDRELFWLDPTVADGVEIPPYDCVTCEVTFAALWPGDHVAQVWFRVAEYSPQSYGVNVNLSGAAAQWPFAMYDSRVWFGEIAVGESLDVTCTIFNQTGDDYSLLTGDPVWWNEIDDQGQFALVGGGGPFALAPGESHTLSFRFTPNVAGEHVASMDLQLPVSGGGGMNVPLECHGFATLDFGSVAAGTAIDDTLSIRNNTLEPLTGSLNLTGGATVSALAANSDCQAFAIVAGGGDYEVAPGASHEFVVRYQSTEAGAHTCAVETGRGTFTLVGTATTATGVEPGSTPSVFALHPCTPNPFNPRTTIKYDLPEAGPVRLSVFDVAGRLVRTLVDDTMPQGGHEAVWDGRDSTGREVGSGSYLARLEFEGKVETVRMGLVR